MVRAAFLKWTPKFVAQVRSKPEVIWILYFWGLSCFVLALQSIFTISSFHLISHWLPLFYPMPPNITPMIASKCRSTANLYQILSCTITFKHDCAIVFSCHKWWTQHCCSTFPIRHPAIGGRSHENSLCTEILNKYSMKYSSYNLLTHNLLINSFQMFWSHIILGGIVPGQCSFSVHWKQTHTLNRATCITQIFTSRHKKAAKDTPAGRIGLWRQLRWQC